MVIATGVGLRLDDVGTMFVDVDFKDERKTTF